MSETMLPGTDVRERVVDEIIVTVRTLCPGAAGSVATAAYAAADRMIALLRTPRGEEEERDSDLVAAAEYIESRIPEAARCCADCEARVRRYAAAVRAARRGEGGGE